MRILIFFFVLIGLKGYTQVTIRVENQPNEKEIYVAGNFNNWNPKSHRLNVIERVHYITLTTTENVIEYKFTKGNWQNAETKVDGSFYPNRKSTFESGDTLICNIEGWNEQKEKVSTKTENVILFQDSFPFPQLDTLRRIWVYLPPDYFERKFKHYPIIVLLDGQNLFDVATAFSGEWRVDEVFDSLFEEGKKVPIVVGVENGGSKRIIEYTPWQNENYETGNGNETADFIASDLLPTIRKNYRVKKSRRHTFIGGSSLGGLMSFFILLKQNDSFSGALVYSPAFWINPEIYDWALLNPGKKRSKIILISGAEEHSSIIEGHKKLQSILPQLGLKQSLESIEPNGKHNEIFWGKSISWTIERLLCRNCI